MVDVVIQITKTFTSRANALSSIDAIESKVPSGWVFSYSLKE